MNVDMDQTFEHAEQRCMISTFGANHNVQMYVWLEYWGYLVREWSCDQLKLLVSSPQMSGFPLLRRHSCSSKPFLQI